ncbi:hypothetical protein [Undibacterium flavidum]|uniref:Uncharacterized protein n=1 Tax=Undibacterium flavidum TaxID=2762297 RepID=A0ABR6Y684_9BURK|nr:hypothetical protein [Undibacterium flavidum]MBC3872132.1 hypothetical protein [Undibacterium flavidum]
MKACSRKRPVLCQLCITCVLGGLFVNGLVPEKAYAQSTTQITEVIPIEHPSSTDDAQAPDHNFIASTDEPLVKFSGFGTLGVTYNTSQKFDYLRDLLQTKGAGYTRQFDLGVDSILGLQLSSNINDYLDATVQVVARRGEKDFQPDISWGFLKYFPNDNLDLRLGRLGFDVYPLADSRNVAYSYTWVRPPVEYFGGLIVSYIDGADLVYKYAVGANQAKIKLFAGKANERILAQDPDIYFSLKGAKIWGGHLEFQSQNWLTRLGYASLHFNQNFVSIQGLIDALQSPLFAQISPTAPALGENLSFKDKEIHYLSAGVVYDDGPLQAQLMLSRLQSQTLSFNSNVAAFFTLAYRLKSWTPYFTWAKTHPLNAKSVNTGLPPGIHPAIDQVEAGIQGFLKATRNEQNSVSIGLRYNLNQTSDLKFQFDHMRNQERLIIRNTQPDWDGKANIISVSYNFIFN